MWGLAFGWGLFGLLIGLAVSFTGGSQMWKGALGGLLGGIAGGLLLEASRSWMEDPLMGKAVGLLLTGALVGIFTALVVFLLSKAWLEVASGKLKDTESILDKFLPAGGRRLSSWRLSVNLYPDNLKGFVTTWYDPSR